MFDRNVLDYRTKQSRRRPLILQTSCGIASLYIISSIPYQKFFATRARDYDVESSCKVVIGDSAPINIIY